MQKKILLFMAFMLLAVSVSVGIAAEDDVLQQGIAQYRAENYEEALSLLLKAKGTTAAYYLGLTYKNLERHHEAKEQFLLSLTQTPIVQDAYTELIETLYILGDLEGAKQWLKKAEDAKVKPAHTAYLEGQILMKEGRYESAVAAFTRAKEFDRSLSQTSDFQIALAQVKMRRYDDARKSLQAISAIDPNSDMAAFAQEYEKEISRAAATSKKWHITAGIAYQYDDNVLLKPTGDIPGVDISHESDSSAVATFGLVTPSLVSGRWSLHGRFNFYSNTHFSLHTHDLITQNVSVIPAYSFEKASLSFPFSYSYVWLHQRGYLDLLAFRPTLQLMVAPGHFIQASAGYSRQDMKQDSIDPDESRDADIYTVSAGYMHPFNQGRNLFNLIYEFSRFDAEGRNWENNGHRLSAGFLMPFFRDDMNLILAADALLQDYDNTHTIFDKKRKDRIYTGSGNLRWDINRMIALSLQYSHTRADSNIGIYDYRRNIVTAGIEARF